MSHYTVAVITAKKENLENMLAPYDENIEVEPYIERTKEEIIKKSKERKERILKELKDGRKITEWEHKYLDAITDEELYKVEADDYE